MLLHSKSLPTPLGVLHLAATDKSVVALTWSRGDLARMHPEATFVEKNSELLAEAARQLEEYLAGERKAFRLPFAARGTPFQEKVWSELSRISFGEKISYRILAERIGNPAATRAVGSANGKNPLCIFIPCHRVVRAAGSPGGYSGGEAMKIKLLELEARR